jgi:two-component system sensor histidine kinase BaeS
MRDGPQQSESDNGVMLETGQRAPVRWFQSLYFRIALTFLFFVVMLLAAQNLVLNRFGRRPPVDRSPNTLVAIVAADLRAAFEQDPTLDADAYLKQTYQRAQPIYAVMKSGKVVSNRAGELSPTIRQSIDAMLGGQGLAPSRGEPAVPVPFVTAPLEIADQLRGIVVLPPAPPPSPLARDFDRLFSIPGMAILVMLSATAAWSIFRPTMRRVRSLQLASRQLGEGDLSARASEDGADEIAELAAWFNKMASELAARDAALRTSDSLRRQMLADVSHELKTPLTAMRGYVETLADAEITLDQPTRERYLAILGRETARLDRIVKDLLDLARLENGVGALNKRVFAISRVFDHVTERHHQEIAARQLTVRIHVEETVDQIEADPDRIEQVVENLFANALRYAPDLSVLELSAAAGFGCCVLRVEDGGRGIPNDHLPFVFDRFYKVDPARANASSGSGLGLAITKAIVDSHQGTIEVASEPGRTVFTVKLPLDWKVQKDRSRPAPTAA